MVFSGDEGLIEVVAVLQNRVDRDLGQAPGPLIELTR